MTEDCVVLVSGGMDSVTLAHYLVKVENKHPRVLFFDYGQKHVRELREARSQSKILELDANKIPLGNIFPGSGLTSGDSSKGYYVPNRNMVLLSLAIKFAEEIGLNTVYVGSQKHERQIWDTTAEFVARMNAVLELNDKNKITIIAPFADMSKAEILEIGLVLGVDYYHTWSCYEGQEKACGKCSVCLDRLAAFKEQEVEDPIPYVTK